MLRLHNAEPGLCARYPIDSAWLTARDLTEEITPALGKSLYQLRKALLSDNLIKSWVLRVVVWDLSFLITSGFLLSSFMELSSLWQTSVWCLLLLKMNYSLFLRYATRWGPSACRDQLSKDLVSLSVRVSFRAFVFLMPSEVKKGNVETWAVRSQKYLLVYKFSDQKCQRFISNFMKIPKSRSEVFLLCIIQ